METRSVPHIDSSGEAVKTRFHTFLASFRRAGGESSQQNRVRNTYEEQIMTMIRNDKTTVYVDFTDINQFDRELGEAIQMEYCRFEPFLRTAVQDYVGSEHRDYVYDMDKGTREFFVSIYKLPRVERIRNMRTDTIGRLISFSGTVTRLVLFFHVLFRKRYRTEYGIINAFPSLYAGI